jgi:hypothetical protein
VTENTDTVSIEGQKGYTFGAAPPGTCTTADVFFETDATAGQNWWFCTATDTWTQQLNTGAGGSGAKWSGFTKMTAGAAASATVYFGNPDVAPAGSDTSRMVSPVSGTIKNVYGVIRTAQPSGGSLVCTMRIDSVDSTPVLTWALSAAADTVAYDTTHMPSVTAGQRLSFKCVNNAGGGTSAIASFWWTVE